MSKATIRRSVIESLVFVTLAVIAWSAVAQAGPTLTPTATPITSPTALPTASPTASPTATPTPSPHCDIVCEVDKKCSVGGSAPQDSCVASVGEEVTYTYDVTPAVFPNVVFRVYDDKLGSIGQTSGERLTRTTTLTQTTTNTASTSLIEGGCYCVAYVDDSVTVTVVIPTPTATPSPTPTITPTFTPTPTPGCEDLWPIESIVTIAKGQSAANNVNVSHLITGNIIDPVSVCPDEGACTAHRIPVCAGTGVTIGVTGSTDNTNIGRGVISCDAGGCFVGAVNVTEKYKSVSADGKDTDRITLLPQ